MNNNVVAIVTMNKYPNGDAGSIRQHWTAKMFSELGYLPFVIGYGKKTNDVKKYDGIPYFSLGVNNQKIIARIINRLLFGFKALALIEKRINEIGVIVVVDVLPYFFNRIERIAQKNNIIIIHDSVEWYSPEEFKKKEKSIEYILKNHINTKIIKDPWRVMAISTYLKSHFLLRCPAVEYIPVVMNVKDTKPRLDTINRKKRIFVYAGSPGKKDYLKTILEGYDSLSYVYKKKAEMHILGVNEKELINICEVPLDILMRNKDSIKIFGKVNHNIAIDEVKNADFTVLLRDSDLRYAKAGFPTKIVESITFATPVMCNFSSDLDKYLVDNNNAIIIKSTKSSDVKKAFESAIEKNNNEMMKMRMKARETAEKNFDYHLYVEKMNSLICMRNKNEF